MTAVLECVDQALPAEDDLEDVAVDAAGLGVGADERPGGAARALGRLEDLFPATADHLGVRRRIALSAARRADRWGPVRTCRVRMRTGLSGGPRGARLRGTLRRERLRRRVPVHRGGPAPRRRRRAGCGRSDRRIGGGSARCGGGGGRGSRGSGGDGRGRRRRSSGGWCPGGWCPGGRTTRRSGGGPGSDGLRRARGGVGRHDPAVADPRAGRAGLPRGRSRRSTLARSRGAPPRHEQTGHEELELEARRRRPDHLGESLRRHIGRSRQADRADGARLHLHAGQLVVGQRAERGAGLRPRQSDDQQVAQALQEVLDEAPRVVPGGDDAVHHPEHTGAVGGGQGVDAGVEESRVRVPQEGDGALVVHLPVDRAADELVHDGQGVAHAAAAGAGDQWEDARADRDVLGTAEVGEVPLERVRCHQAEGVVVGARADGADDLLRLGGGEDELHVRRRLLDELEQGVEPLRGDHVGLVEDEDLESIAGGGEGGALAQIAGVVDAVVGGGIDLDDVEAARAAGGQVPAARALPAGGVGGEALAVQAARQDAGRCGLAAAARTGEEVGVSDAVATQRSHERGGHVVLADDVLEGVGAVAAVQGGGHGPSLIGTDDAV